MNRPTPGPPVHADPAIRLQKHLAACGVASRRQAEELILAGRIAVNGAVVRELGTRVVPERDEVTADGKRVRPPDATATIVLNKPRGYLCTRAEGEGRTVYDLLKEVSAPVVPAGRLDKNSEGLLLLSSDGGLVHRLTHPRFDHPKTYRVTVSGLCSPEVLRRLGEPFEIEGYQTRPARVKFLRAGGTPGRNILEFVLREGRNRQIRRMCEQTGLEIHRLVRTQIGPLHLGSLRPGCWRPLSSAELAILQNIKPPDKTTPVRPGSYSAQAMARKTPYRRGSP